MELKTISNEFSVSPQITADDVAAIKTAGFHAIICNRPDGEEADQPSFEEIETSAKTAGIEIRYLPVQTGMINDEDVAAFGAALQDIQRPVLAYCRTGTRSATLWSLHEAKMRPMSEILAATTAAGYDMTGVARLLASDVEGQRRDG
ncbi:MAG: TIGR01244 family sulfur transferase [Pseudomonadota bacterium]